MISHFYGALLQIQRSRVLSCLYRLLREFICNDFDRFMIGPGTTPRTTFSATGPRLDIGPLLLLVKQDPGPRTTLTVSERPLGHTCILDMQLGPLLLPCVVFLPLVSSPPPVLS